MQRLRVRYRPEAVADLDEVYQHIYRISFSPEIAEGLIARICARCSRIGDAPRGGRVRDDLEPGLRMLEGNGFFESAVIVAGKGDRFVALGRIDGRPYAAAFKPLGIEAVSVISLRIASKKERQLI